MTVDTKDISENCYYCGVVITENNYCLREVRTINELGDYKPCCDDCAKATSHTDTQDA